MTWRICLAIFAAGLVSDLELVMAKVLNRPWWICAIDGLLIWGWIMFISTRGEE